MDCRNFLNWAFGSKHRVLLIGGVWLAIETFAGTAIVQAGPRAKPRQPLSNLFRPVNRVRMVVRGPKNRLGSTIILARPGRTRRGSQVSLNGLGSGLTEVSRKGDTIEHRAGKLHFLTTVKDDIRVDIPQANLSVRSSMLADGLKVGVYQTVSAQKKTLRKRLARLRLSRSGRERALEKANASAIRSHIDRSLTIPAAESAALAAQVTSDRPSLYREGRFSVRVTGDLALQLGQDLVYGDLVGVDFQVGSTDYRLILELEDSDGEEIMGRAVE